MGRLARCKWPGFEFTAELLETHADGTHLMRSHDDTPRFVRGSGIAVKPAEIIRWFDE